jgi:hypothetical protein
MKFEEQLKAKNVVQGTRAITRVTLPLVNSPGPLLVDQPELAEQRARDGHPERIEIVVGMRAITPLEQCEILVGANGYAEQHGVPLEQRNDLNPIYSLGYNLHLLAIACVDPDGDAKDPEPFFGARGNVQSAVEVMLRSPHLTRDSITFLAAHQEAWQDKVSPQAKTIPSDQLWEVMGEMAASTDLGPFLNMRPGMHLQLLRFSVSQLLSLLAQNKPSDSSSSDKS